MGKKSRPHTAPRKNKRRDERVPAPVAVQFKRGNGVARDVSATGIYFETGRRHRKGSTITLTMELRSPAGKMHFKCKGKIVRVEEHDGKIGIAVEINDSSLGYRRT